MCKDCPPISSIPSVLHGFRKLPPPPAFKDLPGTGNVAFDHAIRVAFMHEGVYSNDPDDAGGPTKYGISLRFAQQLGDLDKDGKLDLDLNNDGVVDIKDIKLIIPPVAVKIYKKAFWDPYKCYQFMAKEIAIKTFDLSINMGPKQSHILLQRALRAVGAHVNEDGVIGPKSLAAIQATSPSALLAALRSEAAGFYRNLVTKNPKSKKYLNGWLYRAYY